MNRPLTRRAFLQASGAAAGAAALPGWLHAAPAVASQTRHVVLIAFAGGVRSRDTIGSPANVPSLMRLAKGGVVYPNVGVANLGHYGATLSIFTGIPEFMGIRENSRSYNPTVFEYLRRDLELPASSCWLSTNNGSQAINFAYGLHRSYGPEYGANVIDGESLFNQEFRDVLGQFGTPRADRDEDRAALGRLRQAMSAGGDARRLNDAQTAARVESYILDELTDKNAVRMTGPGASDAKAIHVATKVLQIFQPRVLGISLASADVAHGSYNRYVDVIRRNDQQIGNLLDTIESDNNLRGKTAVFVLPEFGRDRDLNQRNGLDHGDGSDRSESRCSASPWGPDFQAGRRVITEGRAVHRPVPHPDVVLQ